MLPSVCPHFSVLDTSFLQPRVLSNSLPLDIEHSSSRSVERELQHLMAEYMTVAVRRIANTASEEDIQSFFNRKIPDNDPVVKALVNDANHAFKSATVTFKGRTKAECKAVIKKLKDPLHRTLCDGIGVSSTLDFDENFLGLTELANNCAYDENPYFEYASHSLACFPTAEAL